jgi:hypothetical protein
MYRVYLISVGDGAALYSDYRANNPLGNIHTIHACCASKNRRLVAVGAATSWS